MPSTNRGKFILIWRWSSGISRSQLLKVKRRIELIYQNFNHPVYNQLNREEFVPGLSIIDCLMNNGLETYLEIISNAGI